MKETNCILCNCNEFSILKTISTDKYSDLIKNKDVKIKKVICLKCGLVYQHPQWEESELQRLYTKFRFDEVPPEIYLHSKEIKAQEDFYGIKNFVPDNSKGKILDIGCAEGSFLRLFQTQGWATYGVEPTDYGNYGKEKYGLNIETGFFEEINFPNEYFDIVSMLRVIEHVCNPIKILLKVKKILKRENGLIYIQTPNVLKPYGNPDEFFGTQHLWLFSTSTLVLLLENLGFKIVEFETSRDGLRAIVNKRGKINKYRPSSTIVVKRNKNKIFFIKFVHKVYQLYYPFYFFYEKCKSKLSSILRFNLA